MRASPRSSVAILFALAVLPGGREADAQTASRAGTAAAVPMTVPAGLAAPLAPAALTAVPMLAPAALTASSLASAAIPAPSDGPQASDPVGHDRAALPARDLAAPAPGGGESVPAADEKILEARAEKIVQGLDLKVRELYSTSGFAGEEELADAANRTGDESKKALEMLRDEDFDVAIRLPQSTRASVPRRGILNMHSTNDSQGAMRSRDAVEAALAGMPVAEWLALDAEVKMKYAALYPKPESGLNPPVSLDAYAGPDKYILKMDRIRDRMTATPGDSLNRAIYWGIPGDGKMESWDQLFVPWKDRAILAPALAEGLEASRVGLTPLRPMPSEEEMRGMSSYELKHLEEEITNQAEVVGKGALKGYKMRWTPNMDYIEAQVWGPISLDDVAAFEFMKDPPQGEFLDELLERGIQIRDGRRWPPVVWRPQPEKIER